MQELTSKIITWSEARNLGLKRYFPGKPCSKGHLSEKWVLSKCCIACRKENIESHNLFNRIYNAERRKNNPELMRKINRESMRKTREERPEKIKEWNKRFTEADPQRIRDYSLKWRKNNPEKVKVMDRNKKARRKNAIGKHTAKEIEELFSKQHGKCAICFISIHDQYHADHIEPLIRGGTNYIKNIQLCCPKCNLTKQAKNPLIFARELGRLL